MTTKPPQVQTWVYEKSYLLANNLMTMLTLSFSVLMSGSEL